jgi:hypothetical protein
MNTITVVSQLINEAHSRFGPVAALEVPEALWAPAMDAVADAGGEVGLDYCVVDGVRVQLAADGFDQQALVHVAGADQPQPLDLAD